MLFRQKREKTFQAQKRAHQKPQVGEALNHGGHRRKVTVATTRSSEGLGQETEVESAPGNGG